MPRFGSSILTRRPRRLGQAAFPSASRSSKSCRHMDLERHVVGRIILRQNVAQEIREASNASSSGISSQKNSRRPTIRPSRIVKSCSASRDAFAIKSENIDVAVSGRRHLLLFAQGEHRPMQIAIFCSQLKLDSPRKTATFAPRASWRVPCSYPQARSLRRVPLPDIRPACRGLSRTARDSV